MSISIDKALVWLALGSQTDRQGLWDALGAQNQLLVGAPQRVPDDNWRLWMRGIGGGGSIGAAGPTGPTGPQGPTGPGFSEYQTITTNATFPTESVPYVVAQTLSATLTGGDYRIGWNLEAQAGIGAPMDFTVVLDGAITISEMTGFLGTEFQPFSGWGVYTIAAGTFDVTIEIASQAGAGNPVTVQRRRLEIWRVA